MGIVFGFIFVVALAISSIVAPISIVVYIRVSRRFETGNWAAWSCIFLLSGSATVIFGCYPVSQLPYHGSAFTDEVMRAYSIFAGSIGLSLGIATFSGLLALAVPKGTKAATVETTKSFFGGQRIKYNCPSCDERLRSPINEAGTTDTCPNCSVQFTVPTMQKPSSRTAKK